MQNVTFTLPLELVQEIQIAIAERHNLLQKNAQENRHNEIIQSIHARQMDRLYRAAIALNEAQE